MLIQLYDENGKAMADANGKPLMVERMPSPDEQVHVQPAQPPPTHVEHGEHTTHALPSGQQVVPEHAVHVENEHVPKGSTKRSSKPPPPPPSEFPPNRELREGDRPHKKTGK